MGEYVAGRVGASREKIIISDAEAHLEVFFDSKRIKEEGIAWACAVPLFRENELLGVLQVFSRRKFVPDPEWLAFFDTLAGQAAISLDLANNVREAREPAIALREAYDATIEGWSRALDLRDRETEGHSQRVAELTIRLAYAAGMSPEAIVHVRRGALLHDMGKIAIPDTILHKPAPLTPEEWEIMRKHPIYAKEMLEPIAYLRPAIVIPYSHHEKWDGTGYPQRLKGEEIPLEARLFAVVDVWDALSSDRPNRPDWSSERIVRHLEIHRGTHFDPYAVDLFIRLLPQILMEQEQGCKSGDFRD